ncbi:MAG: hypothetical protein M1839_005400 [Geoglossum umbratile]|nr:MAG: hypothetical protein M1839_005400 [Geoglossum umbratile]
MSADLSYTQRGDGKAEDSISPDEFEKAISELLSPATQDSGPSKTIPLKDIVFPQITRLLELVGKPTWSLRPRTYAILYMISRVDVMNAFVTEGLYDISLPFSQKTLPDVLKNPAARLKFLELQPLVISEQAATVESGQGRHRHFLQDGDVHFKRIKQLGQGGFGEVDHVWSRLSHNEFARKRIPRGKTFKKDKLAMLDFERELGTLKRLSHHHLVEYIGSYTDPRYVALIMSPVANSNLAEFLTLNPFPLERLVCLRQFYGCLVSALAYLHESQIRHKDIKPSNILVYGDSILITDFGTSLDWTDRGHSTTSNTLTTAITRAYCSPEVFNSDRRNSSSDIYSLGCVFLEMTTVLRGRTLGSMKEYFYSHGTNESYVRTNSEAMNLWLEEIRDIMSPGYDNQPIEWIKDMVKVIPESRPGARELVSQISDCEGGFCGTCCAGDDRSADSSYRGSMLGDETASATGVDKDIHGHTKQQDVTEVGDGTAKLPEEQTTKQKQDKQPHSLSDGEQSSHLQRAPSLDTTLNRTSQEQTAAQLLTTNGFYIGTRHFDKRKALHWAATKGYDSVVRLVLQKGADVEAKDESGKTALQAAAEGGNIEVVRVLLAAKAKVNAPVYNAPGRTPLQAAAGGGHIEVVEALLAAKATVNVDTDLYGGRSALQAAAGGGHIEVVEALLAAKATVNIPNSPYNGCTALQEAAKAGHIRVVEVLLAAKADVNTAATLRSSRTALQAAAEGGHIGVVEMLLAAGALADSPASPSNGRTALQAAAGSGHVNVVEMLLAAKADINAAPCHSYGRTALQAAAGSGHVNVVDMLLAAKADINATPCHSYGRTALQAAAEGGHIKVVEMLLVAGALANSPASPSNGRTALQAAAEGGYMDIIEILLAAGASINAAACDLHGRTALQAAAEHGYIAIVEMLLTAGARVNAPAGRNSCRTALQAAAGGGHIKIVEALLAAGADVNGAPSISDGRTALQAAAEHGHIDVVEMLLAAKADVNAAPSSSSGYTALQAAKKGNHDRIIGLLKLSLESERTTSGFRKLLQLRRNKT